MIEGFTGQVIRPEDEGYEAASTIFVREGSPAVILRPKTAKDVSAAIDYAVSKGLEIAVRSGGHSGAGLSTVDDGALIDLSLMNKIEILDAEQGLVRIGSGATWGEAIKELGKHKLAISSGDTSSVGVGGLTLGGGIGWMVSKYGLAIDSVVAAEVVTADGNVVRATKTEHADLFWAIRGGGGNFGIVTSFEYKAHHVVDVVAGPIMYKLENLAYLLKGWRDAMCAAPRELTTTCMILPSFGDNPPMVIITCCYIGDEASGMRAIEPLLTLAGPIDNKLKVKTYPEVLEDVHPPKGMRVVVHNAFFKDFSDELIGVIASQTGQMLQIRWLGGAVRDMPSDATAFGYRDSEVLIVAPTMVSPQATDEEITKALEPWRNIAGFGQGSYVNFLSSADEAAVRACYPPATYQRLAEVKATYDPDNVFRRNFNIEPAHPKTP